MNTHFKNAGLASAAAALLVLAGCTARTGGTRSTSAPAAGTPTKAEQACLRDAGGTVWRCLAYSAGTVAQLGVHQGAEDGDGAMAGAGSDSRGEPTTETERVRFDRGATGDELTGRLTPGSSVRYVLGAENGQDLYVRVAARGPDIHYQIFNPDGSFLLDQMTSKQEYRGQLWQSGDHVVEGW